MCELQTSMTLKSEKPGRRWSLQMTPASSSWVQSLFPQPREAHSVTLFSVPLQLRLSSQMRPVPGPYLALWVQPVASVKPSSRQRTWAACSVKSSSQMVPHSPARSISTRPSKGFLGKPASRNLSPWLSALFSGAVDGDGDPRHELHSRHSNSPHRLHCQTLTGCMAGKVWVLQRERGREKLRLSQARV